MNAKEAYIIKLAGPYDDIPNINSQGYRHQYMMDNVPSYRKTYEKLKAVVFKRDEAEQKKFHEKLKKFDDSMKSSNKPAPVNLKSLADAREKALSKGNIHKADAERVLARAKSRTPSTILPAPKLKGVGKGIAAIAAAAALGGAAGIYHLRKKKKK